MNMKTNKGVELKDGQYLVDGRPFFAYSGEFHYFRVPADQWADRLRKARRLGLTVVSSYIPWIWHEPEEGKIDLTGRTRPERDLRKFLSLVQAAGLRFFARPGPVTHGEIQNDGLPDWLVKKEGGINVRQPDGQPCWCPWLPSFYDPGYRRKVKLWYDAVLPVLEGFQASHGGPVLQLQLDNEIHMINWLAKLPDYHPEVMRRYRGFLKGKYGTIGALNAAYGSRWEDFDRVPQPVGDPTKEAWPWLWDWALYYRDHYAGYFEFLAQQVRAHGLRTAVSANVAQFVDFNMYGRGWESIANTNVFRDFARKVPEAVFGGAFQMRHLDFENFHDIVFTIESLRGITTPGVPVNCAELQVGVINDRPRIYSSDVELNLKTCVAHGLNGVNGYLTFAGRSPDEIQLRGNYHEWQAPVDSRGRLRPHAEPLQRFGRFVGSFGETLSRTRTAHDLTLAFDPHYYFTEFIKGPFYDRLQRERNMNFFDGSARVLELLGFNPDLLDLDRATPEELQARPALWLFSLDFMSRAVMEKLVAYVRNGGRVVFNPQVPTLNGSMQPDPFLAEQLGVQVESIRPAGARNFYRDQDELYMVETDMALFKEKGVEVLLRDQEGRACVVRRTVGRGEVLAIGFGLYHQYDYIVALTGRLAHEFGLRPLVRSSRWDVHAALRTEGETGWLYLANFHDAPMPVSLTCTLPRTRRRVRFPERGEVQLPNRSAYFFPLHLPVAEGLFVESADCEVIQARFERQARAVTLEVRGLSGHLTPVVFTGSVTPRRARVDGRPVPLKVSRKNARLTFIATGRSQVLTLKL